MGLITKTVNMKWNSNNKTWYEGKRYVFTKMCEEFEIKAEDLKKNSHIKINVKCDCADCENPYLKPITWQTYNNYLKEDGKYYCKKCAIKLYGAENARISHLKNGKSFYDWCIENYRYDILLRFDIGLNKCNPNDICYSTNTKYYFKCTRGIHPSELKDINSFVNGQEGSIECNQCNSFAQWGIDNICEDFLEKYWDYKKNKINPWKTPRKTDKKVWIKCQEKDYHGSYKIRGANFCIGGRCTYCNTKSSGKIHSLDSLGKLLEDKELLSLWGDENKKSPYKYSPYSKQYIWWVCPEGKHENYIRKIQNSNNYDFRCPKCSREREESFIQEKTRLYIEGFNYIVLHENNCNIVAQSPKIKNKNGRMRYDNEIKELKLLIEVHGVQHYEICYWHEISSKKNKTTPEYELHYQQLKDRYKRIYAKSQGFHYLELPYYTFDKKDTYKTLINNKINEIKQLNNAQEVNI